MQWTPYQGSVHETDKIARRVLAVIAPLTLWMVLIDMGGRFTERMLPQVVSQLGTSPNALR